MKKYNIEVTEEQAGLLINVLDNYSRIGTLQFNRIENHPTISNLIEKKCTPISKKFKVGQTVQVPNKLLGTIREIHKDKLTVDVTCLNVGANQKQNTKIELKSYNIKEVSHTVDWHKYHSMVEDFNNSLEPARCLLYKFNGVNHSLGIYSKYVDDSCRDAYDMLQIIRNELYKDTDNFSNSLASTVVLSGKKGDIKIKRIENEQQ